MIDYISIANKKIPVIATVYEHEQERGLMYKKWPPPAMAFIYDKPDIHKFWMKNTFCPLDIIFCRGQKVVYMCAGEPMSKNLIGPDYPTDLIIELPKGYAQDFSIKLGDKIDLGLSRKSKLKLIDCKYTQLFD